MPREQTKLYDNKLVGHMDHVEGKTLVYNDQMCWGSFYCFVAGERATSETVLLHGAVDIEKKGERMATKPEGNEKKQCKCTNSCYNFKNEPSQRQVTRNKKDKRNAKSDSEPRKSIELRYIVYYS